MKRNVAESSFCEYNIYGEAQLRGRLSIISEITANAGANTAKERIKAGNMERERKLAGILGKLKWMGMLMGIVMYYATVASFGSIVSTVLACIAAVAFYTICENERRRVVSGCVSKHLTEVLAGVGQSESFFEIRTSNVGMIIRIYLVGAGDRTALCARAATDAISRSWYNSKVWITQIADVKSEDEIPRLQKVLDEELIEGIKKK